MAHGNGPQWGIMGLRSQFCRVQRCNLRVSPPDGPVLGGVEMHKEDGVLQCEEGGFSLAAMAEELWVRRGPHVKML